MNADEPSEERSEHLDNGEWYHSVSVSLALNICERSRNACWSKKVSLIGRQIAAQLELVEQC